MTTKTKKWTDEAVAQLNEIVGSESPVSAATVEKAASVLEVSARSVASKLRNMEREVASMATAHTPTFSEDEGAQLAAFVRANPGVYTYKDIAENFAGGKFNPKQVQGKLLAQELTGMVKPTEKVEAAKTYSEAEEAKFLSLANSGAYLEDIAEALGKSLNSVRGKALSLLRAETITTLPKQRTSHAKDTVDPVEALGASIAEMTVAEIAAKIDKTERGVRTLLTRRGLDAKDYSGSSKKEKAEGKKATA